jgi:hypothetical protein
LAFDESSGNERGSGPLSSKVSRMSFSLFVVALGAPFAEEDFRQAFDPFLSEPVLGGWLIRYDERNETTIDCTFSRSRTSDSFAVSRPCTDPRLFHAIHSLMKTRTSFLTFPAPEPVCLVATREAAPRVRQLLDVDSPDFASAVFVCANGVELRERCLV